MWRRFGSAWSSVSQRGREQSSSSSPPLPPSFLSTVFQCDGCLFLSLVRGGSWLGCSVVPAMGALFSLGAGCQKWKPLDIPGTQPPLSDAVVNVVLLHKKKKSYCPSLSLFKILSGCRTYGHSDQLKVNG